MKINIYLFKGLPSTGWTDYIKFEELEMDKANEVGSGAFGTVFKGVYH